MQFGEKTNGQTFRKTDKCACSLEKNRMDKHLEKQTCTHVVWGKNKQTNISIKFRKKANAVLRNRGSKNEWTNIFKNKANAVWRKINGQTFPKTAKCSLEKKTNGQTFRNTDKSTFRKTQMDKHFKKQYTRDHKKCNNKCYKQFATPPSPPPKKKQKL